MRARRGLPRLLGARLMGRPFLGRDPTGRRPLAHLPHLPTGRHCLLWPPWVPQTRHAPRLWLLEGAPKLGMATGTNPSGITNPNPHLPG